MPYRDVDQTYQASSGPLCTWEVPYARLDDPTPSLHKPAQLLGTAGTQLTGTLISLDAANSIATINFAPCAVHYHLVRNVLTYSQSAEDTWATLDVGTVVYYDGSGTMPAGWYLSLSPLDSAGAANSVFGFVMLTQTEIPDGFSANANPYPVGSAIAGVSHTDIGIMQVGIGR